MVSKPSHHDIAVRNSLGSKCVPGSPEGRTETQEVAKEAEAERRQALFAGEDKSYKLLKDKLSSLGGEISAREETRWQILERWHLKKRLSCYALNDDC